MNLPEEVIAALGNQYTFGAEKEAIVRHCAEIAYNFDGEQFVSPRGAIRRAILAAFDLKEKK